MDPFTALAGALCLAVLAAVGLGGFAVAVHKASRAQLPLEELEKRFAAKVAEERATDRRFFAQALEEAADIGETIKQHRARVEGRLAATKKKDAGEEAEPPPRELTRDEKRDQLLRIARARRVAS